jgi:hypothetical protein
MIKNKLINKNNQGRSKVTNQRSTPSSQQYVSKAAMGSTTLETKLLLGQQHHTTSVGQTFHLQSLWSKTNKYKKDNLPTGTTKGK